MGNTASEFESIDFPSWGPAESFRAQDCIIPEVLNDELICPISREYVLDPVLANICGHCFDKSSIDEYISRTRVGSGAIRCPVCRVELRQPYVVPQHLMKAWIGQRLTKWCPFDGCERSEMPLSEWNGHIQKTCAFAS